MTTSVTRVSAAAVPAVEKPPPEVARSVLAFNEWLYRNTRYSYYNYRIFAFSHRYRQLEEEEYRGMSFRTGPLSHDEGMPDR